MLIAESGATKTAWRWIKPDQSIYPFRTTGFNPNVMTRQKIRRDLMEIVHVHLHGASVESVYFYGAGLGNEHLVRMMVEVLQEAFPQSRVVVSHDLLGAARSTGHPEGIVGILGTGSNSARYRDGHIVEQKGGLGYLFGDEGSGADLGKHLVKGLLEGVFPPKVKAFIEAQEGMNIPTLQRAIYQTERPNVRLAQMAKYLSEIKDQPAVHDMIMSRLLAFLDHSICLYPNYQTLPIHFIGSIAYHFVDLVRTACAARGIEQLEVTRDPIENLVAFHQKHTKLSLL